MFPGLGADLVASGRIAWIGQAGVDHLFQLSHIVRRQLLADAGQCAKGPVVLFQPPGIVGGGIKFSVRIDDRFVVDQGEVEYDAGEVGDQQIGAAEYLVVVRIPVPLQLIRGGIALHELVHHFFFRREGLRVRADHNVIAGIQQNVDNFAAELFENGTLAPGGGQQDSARMGRRASVGGQPCGHVVHIGNANFDQFLGGQVPQLLQRPHIVHLILAGEQEGIIVVDAEALVSDHITGRVEHMDVPVHLMGALPLVDIQSRRAGEYNGGVQKVQLGISLVSTADKFRSNMRKFVAEGRIVLRRGHIDHVHAPLVQFPADRLEYAPVALVIGEDDDGQLLLVRFHLFAAAQKETQFEPPAFQQIGHRADNADQNGKQHTSRAGINVKLHVLKSPSQLTSFSHKISVYTI